MLGDHTTREMVRSLLKMTGDGHDHMALIESEIGKTNFKIDQLIEQRKAINPLDLGEIIGCSFENLPEGDLYEALFGADVPMRTDPATLNLTSALCRQIHFSSDEFRYWMRAMGRRPRLHRKDWEWFYIAQSLWERGVLTTGRRGLAFAVGREPLPALFARFGCTVVATDQAPDAAAASGWGGTNMYSANVETLLDEKICDRERFLSSVSFQHADMNDIPSKFDGGFDFCWSSCAFEHLGSLKKGTEFVQNSLATLRPGGIAVHTTEFNISSNTTTPQTEASVVYRRRDIEELVQSLSAAGHDVSPVDWTSGSGLIDRVIDRPPYRQSPHLKLEIDGYHCTSIGLIIRRGG